MTLYVGHALAVLRELAPGSVDCCTTSPPYWGLRDYGVPGQLGLEPTPEQYVAAIVAVFMEVHRVLAPDGTLWLNLGDSYATGAGSVGEHPGGGEQGERWKGHRGARGGSPKHASGAMGPMTQPNRMPIPGLKPKDLVGIPWRVAFALQEAGWWLRNAVVWHKPNAMPHPVGDRLTNRYEQVFLLTKSERYFFDLDAIREPLAYPEALDGTRVFGGRNKGDKGGVGATERNRGHNVYGATGMAPQANMGPTGERHRHASEKGKNPGDLWSMVTRPYPEAHFATFPIDLPLRCIKAGCKPGGVVLDPFSGSGTTGAAARDLGHQYVGIDLSAEYHDLAKRRFAQGRLAV